MNGALLRVPLLSVSMAAALRYRIPGLRIGEMRMRTCTLTLVILVYCASVTRGQDTAQYLFEQGYSHQVGEGVDRDTKRALAYYTEAIRLEPTLYAPLYNAAFIYHGQGNYAQAQNYFIKAAKSASAMGRDAERYEAMARNGLGTCFQMLEKYSAAEKQFDIARRMRSDYVEAHYNYINILVREERTNEAVAALKMAEKMAPSDRYDRFKGLLAVKKKEDRLGHVGGLVLFILLFFAYGIYLKRSKRSN